MTDGIKPLTEKKYCFLCKYYKVLYDHPDMSGYRIKDVVKAVEGLRKDIICEKDIHPALREKLIELIDKRFGK